MCLQQLCEQPDFQMKLKMKTVLFVSKVEQEHPQNVQSQSVNTKAPATNFTCLQI